MRSRLRAIPGGIVLVTGHHSRLCGHTGSGAVRADCAQRGRPPELSEFGDRDVRPSPILWLLALDVRAGLLRRRRCGQRPRRVRGPPAKTGTESVLFLFQAAQLDVQAASRVLPRAQGLADGEKPAGSAGIPQSGSAGRAGMEREREVAEKDRPPKQAAGGHLEELSAAVCPRMPTQNPPVRVPSPRGVHPTLAPYADLGLKPGNLRSTLGLPDARSRTMSGQNGCW